VALPHLLSLIWGLDWCDRWHNTVRAGLTRLSEPLPPAYRPPPQAMTPPQTTTSPVQVLKGSRCFFFFFFFYVAGQTWPFVCELVKSPHRPLVAASRGHG
jgi:hypothetical protein